MAPHWLIRKELSLIYSPGRKRMKKECDDAWKSFPELPGEHLRWCQTTRGRSEIVTWDGRVLATVEGLSLFPPGPLVPRPPRRVMIGQTTYQVGGRIMNVRVTAPDGANVLSFTGTKNFNGQARAVAHMSNGQTLRFPVRGTSNLNAVMTATDDSGGPVFRIRQVRSPRLEEKRKKVVEILVEPGRQITPELLLVMTTGYHNLDNFFDRGGGG
jgi:hypothetical protein